MYNFIGYLKTYTLQPIRGESYVYIERGKIKNC